ncbi:MAG: hypothetical protein U5J83_13640 [Bryobacterales bacterium]|nr:hypothetical protein [Bryobacterales bacterium]
MIARTLRDFTLSRKVGPGLHPARTARMSSTRGSPAVSRWVGLNGLRVRHPAYSLFGTTSAYAFPFAATGRKEIAAWELQALLEGVDCERTQIKT